MTITEKDKKRFWSKVDIPLGDDGKPDTDKCWMWTAGIFKNNYGKFNICGKMVRAHRVAYILKYNKFDETMCVLHKCDVRGCVNQKHLWLGTKADNNRDRKNKGRNNSPCGDKNGTHTHPESRTSGEKNGRSKLTWKKVDEIRLSAEKQKDLAVKYNVDPSIISEIKGNKIWRFMPPALITSLYEILEEKHG